MVRFPEKTDLILLGSAPKWRRQSRFFSPTVDYVLRKAPCDVMVVAYPQGVLEEDGAVSGHIGVKHVADEAHVMTLAVHPERRRRGFAEEALRQGKGDALGKNDADEAAGRHRVAVPNQARGFSRGEDLVAPRGFGLGEHGVQGLCSHVAHARVRTASGRSRP